jgi:hypothetical protein
MSENMVRTVFTYLIAMVVIVGGGVLVVIPTQLEADTLVPFLTGAIGIVLGFVFGERSASSASSNMPTITTNSPPVTTVVRSPAEQESYDHGDYK